MSEFNYISVIISSIFGFLFSEFWYSSAFLGNRFLFVLKKTKIDLKNPTWLWLVQLLTTITIAVTIELIRILLGWHGMWFGVFIGAIIALLFVIPMMINDGLRMDQPFKAVVMNMAYRIAQLMTMGAVIGSFSK